MSTSPTPKRSALGQGLGALLPPSPKSEGAAGAAREISITQLIPNKAQPRKHFEPGALAELAQSLKEAGMIQPIIVRQSSGGRFEIIAGERRWRAAQLAGFGKVPVVVREVSDEKVLEWALIENLQREDLNPIEEATAIAELMEKFAMTQEQVAQRIGKDRATIANLVRLLKLEPKVRLMVINKKISAGHARALLPLAAAQQERLAEQIHLTGMSVRDAERKVRQLQSVPRASPNTPDANQRAAETALSRKLACKVMIMSAKKGGKIVIEYANLTELNRIYSQIIN